MPICEQDIPESKQSILRRVVTDVVKQLMVITQMPKNTEILFKGDAGSLPLEKKMGKEQPDVSDNDFGTKNILYVEYKDDPASPSAEIIVPQTDDSPPFFLDDEIDFSLRTEKASTTIKIALVFRAGNRTLMEEFRTRFISFTSRQRDLILHEARYDVYLPDYVISILKTVWDNKKKLDSSYMNFFNYINKYSYGHITAKSNLAGENNWLVLDEMQSLIQGNFGVAYLETSEDDDTGVSQELVMEYEINFERPITVLTKFPVSVYNTIIDAEKYVPDASYNPAYDVNVTKRKSFQHLEIISRNGRFFMENETFPAVVQPIYDDWHPQNYFKQLTIMTQHLVQVDLNNKNKLINLNDIIDDMGGSMVMRRFFQLYHHMLNDSLLMPISIKVYENDALLDNRYIEIDDKLILNVKKEVDPKKEYRVLFMICRDLVMMSKTASNILRRTPWFTDEYLKLIHPKYIPSMLPRTLPNKDLLLLNKTLNPNIFVTYSPYHNPSYYRNSNEVLADKNFEGIKGKYVPLSNLSLPDMIQVLLIYLKDNERDFFKDGSLSCKKLDDVLEYLITIYEKANNATNSETIINSIEKAYRYKMDVRTGVIQSENANLEYEKLDEDTKNVMDIVSSFFDPLMDTLDTAVGICDDLFLKQWASLSDAQKKIIFGEIDSYFWDEYIHAHSAEDYIKKMTGKLPKPGESGDDKYYPHRKGPDSYKVIYDGLLYRVNEATIIAHRFSDKKGL